MLQKSCLLLLFQFATIYAQIDTKTYYEQSEDGYQIFIDNNEFCPVSVKISFELLNLKSTQGNDRIFVIPAKAKKINVTNLVAIKKNSTFKFSYKTSTSYGDYFLKNYDADFPYELPFGKGNKFRIGQGYNGTFSHQNQNALDFTMPIGSDIAAARAGIVVAVTQNNNKSCADKSCAAFNNYITILHSDGTFAEYAHIKQNGALVKKGDEVKTGQIIAKSGNVGWSNGPHLHFVVFFQRLDKRETLKTKFKTLSGKVSELVEKNEYEK